MAEAPIRSTSIPQPNFFGRIGTGIGKGLAEQLPKEIERSRLASGLKQLGQKQGLSPFQQFAELSGIPGAVERPQLLQSAADLLRQQAIINSVREGKQPAASQGSQMRSIEEKGLLPASATTSESTQSALNPYIPPSGPEQEAMARRLMAQEPNVYRDIDSARAAIQAQISGNTQQSNALLQKRELEESVQSRAEQKLRNEIATVGAEIPGLVLSDLQQRAIDDVVSGKMSPDQAKIVYGKEADKVSKDFANIRSWGGLGILTKKPKELIGSISALHNNAKSGKYQKQAADELIAQNAVTPAFAYANMYPVSDIKSLNDEIKSLDDINPRVQKALGTPGLAGIGIARPKNEKADVLTRQISPRLARAMGTEGSPLSIGYELDKKGYDSGIWKEYLLDHIDELNLTSNQVDELQKPSPSVFGVLNDWWLKSFSGVK